MSRKHGQLPATDRTSELTKRAHAALIAMEKDEPTAVIYIRAIGLDPTTQLSSEEIAEIEELYGANQRRHRRQWLLIRAARFVLRRPRADEQEILLLLGRSMPRIKVMVDYMIGYWDECYRPKTWVDSLSNADQLEWARLKKEYSREIEKSNRNVEAAKAAYQKVLLEEQTRQLAARLELQDFLKDVGASDAPLLRTRTDDDLQAELAAEFQELGLAVPSFRVGEARASRANEDH